MLDGVYERGEFYLRAMQRLSLLAFGTRPGRLFTRYLAVPFGGSYLLLAFVEHYAEWLSGQELELNTPSNILLLGCSCWGSAGGLVPPRGMAGGEDLRPRAPFPAGRLPALAGAPAVAGERPQQPALTAGLSLPREALAADAAALGIAAGGRERRAALGLGGRLLRDAQPGAELAGRPQPGRTRRRRHRGRLAPHWAANPHRPVLAGHGPLPPHCCKASSSSCTRSTSGSASAAAKAEGQWRRRRRCGSAWFWIAYVVRFLVNVVAEPQLNPIKHFPIVTVAHKIMLPQLGLLTKLLTPPMNPELAGFLAFLITISVPGICGFLAWELRENWRLYAANRPKGLRPALLGPHGETMPRLLKPGLHSGTLPKRFAKLRRAARQRLAGDESRPTRKNREALRRIELGLRRYAEREFVEFFRESCRWQAPPPTTGPIRLANNRVRIAILLPADCFSFVPRKRRPAPSGHPRRPRGHSGSPSRSRTDRCWPTPRVGRLLQALPLTPARSSRPPWSASGRRVAWTSRSPGTCRVAAWEEGPPEAPIAADCRSG